MRIGTRIACGLLVAGLATAGAARAEEAPAKAAEAEARKVLKRIVRVRTPSWGAKRGFLGVELLGLNRELRAFFKAPEDRGVLVKRVEPGSPAEKAGLRVGDVLTGLDGEAVASTWDAIRILGDKPAGHQAQVELTREGKPLRLTAAIEVRERPFVELSKVFRLSQGGDDGEEFELDLTPFEGLRLEEFKGQPGVHWYQGEEIPGLDDASREKLDQRLKGLEEKLRKLEEKLQGGRAAPARDAPT